MDITDLATSMADMKISQGVSTGMMKKALEQTELAGAQIVTMVNATNVPSESTIDIKI